jgi:site-specific recombinase XerD
MNLQSLIAQYISYRRSLGEQWRPNSHLNGFGNFMGADTDIDDIKPDKVRKFLEGADPITQTWHIKLGVLRNFYKYALSRGYAHESPLPTVIPKRPPTFVPHIYSQEELRRLFQVAKSFQRSLRIEPHTLHLMLVTLYATGLRLQELLNLNRTDVNLPEAVITVIKSKFGKTRLVPIGPQLQVLLSEYDKHRPPHQKNAPFFATREGNRIKADTFQHNFRILCSRAGVHREKEACYQPRVHDFRHTFAVHRLISWYRQGADVQLLLPVLSIYMGHVNIRATQVYLNMTPELLEEANARFEKYATKDYCHD